MVKCKSFKQISFEEELHIHGGNWPKRYEFDQECPNLATKGILDSFPTRTKLKTKPRNDKPAPKQRNHNKKIKLRHKKALKL